jgi:hypothetical protein
VNCGKQSPLDGTVILFLVVPENVYVVRAW